MRLSRRTPLQSIAIRGGLLLATLVATAPAAWPPPCQTVFRPAVNSPYAYETSPFYVVTGDLNEDAHADLVVCDRYGNRFTIFLGDGLGEFAPGAGSMLAPGGLPHAVAIADFNLDDHPDIAGCNYYAQNLTMLLGDGSGGFTASSTNLPHPPFPLISDDFNRDARPDLAVVYADINTVAILLGNGAGGFSNAPGPAIVTETFPYMVLTADFDNDGKADLATPNYDTGTVNVFLGAGDGSFSNAPASPLAVGGLLSTLAAGDFDLDGNLDMVAGSLEGHVSLLRGNGNGSFTNAGIVASGGGFIDAMAAADFNGDSNPDFVFPHEGDLRLCLGDGSGQFENTLGAPSGGGNGFAMAAGYYDSDTNLDVATVNEASYVLAVLLNACNLAPVSLCSNVTITIESNCTAQAVVNAGSYDPDGDGVAISQIPPGPYPFGTNVVTLLVADDFNATNACTATVVVIPDEWPRLQIGSDSNAVAISWSAAHGCFVLEATTNLATHDAWMVDSSPRMTNGLGMLVVTNVTTETNRFYRLRYP